MKKVTVGMLLCSLMMLANARANVGQPVTRSERTTIVKAIENKIAKLEVERAIFNGSTLYTAGEKRGASKNFDGQIASLRQRLRQLVAPAKNASARQTTRR